MNIFDQIYDSLILEDFTLQHWNPDSDLETMKGEISRLLDRSYKIKKGTSVFGPKIQNTIITPATNEGKLTGLTIEVVFKNPSAPSAQAIADIHKQYVELVKSKQREVKEEIKRISGVNPNLIHRFINTEIQSTSINRAQGRPLSYYIKHIDWNKPLRLIAKEENMQLDTIKSIKKQIDQYYKDVAERELLKSKAQANM